MSQDFLKRKPYMIVDGTTPGGMARGVSQGIRDGFVPYGSPMTYACPVETGSIEAFRWCQAMVWRPSLWRRICLLFEGEVAP
jgi:hypothetical protein